MLQLGAGVAGLCVQAKLTTDEKPHVEGAPQGHRDRSSPRPPPSPSRAVRAPRQAAGSIHLPTEALLAGALSSPKEPKPSPA